MEATGVYWKPVWFLLEERFKLLLANPREVRNRPGRKTDVNDANWIADLMAHGLVRGSFVPPVQIRDLRDLTRTRVQLVHERSRYTLRLQKTLEDAHLKLRSVVTDILGKTGRSILEAIIRGETDPQQLARLRRRGVKAKDAEMIEALQGRVRDHHRLLLQLHLEQIDRLNAAIGELEARADLVLKPYQEDMELLETISGVGPTAARVIAAEIGLDMSQFPTVGDLISWAGLCPGNDSSAGKQRSSRLRKGNKWLKTTLIQAAWAAVRVKDSYLRAQYYRLRSRRGPQKAIVAVAASILRAAYFMLLRRVPYEDLGGHYFERNRGRDRVAQQLLRRLRRMGLEVVVKKAEGTIEEAA
jgi:transposase